MSTELNEDCECDLDILCDLLLLRTFLKSKGHEGKDDGDGGFIVQDPFDATKTIVVHDAKAFGHRPTVEQIETGKTVAEYLVQWGIDARSVPANMQLDCKTELEALYLCPKQEDCPYSADELSKINPQALALAHDLGGASFHATLRLNQRFCYVSIGDGDRVYDARSGRLMKIPSFKNLIASDVIMTGKEKSKLISSADVWMNHASRRTCFGKAMYPNGKRHDGQVYNGPELNVWRGYIWVASNGEGDASLIQQHYESVFHDGCSETYSWDYAWHADMFYNPYKKPHAHIIRFDALGGSGKSMVAQMWRNNIIGHFHSTLLSGSESLTRKHNADLETAVFVIGEELTWAGSYEERNVLYSLLSNDTLSVEPKGIDRRNVPNYIRALLHSNNERPVPIEAGNRRFAVFPTVMDEMLVGAQHSEKRKSYFTNLLAATQNPNCVSAFMKFLQDFDCEKYNLYQAPNTAAANEMIIKNFDAKKRWLYDVAWQGGFTYRHEGKTEFTGLNADKPTAISKVIVLDSASPHFGARSHHGTQSSVGAFLSGLAEPRDNYEVCDFTHGIVRRVYVVPPLPLFRAKVANSLGLAADAFMGAPIASAAKGASNMLKLIAAE